MARERALRNHLIQLETQLVSDMVATIRDVGVFSVEQHLRLRMCDIYAARGTLSAAQYDLLNDSLVDITKRYKKDDISLQDFISELTQILRRYELSKMVSLRIHLFQLPPIILMESLSPMKCVDINSLPVKRRIF